MSKETSSDQASWWIVDITEGRDRVPGRLIGHDKTVTGAQSIHCEGLTHAKSAGAVLSCHLSKNKQTTNV